jgi:hypothetical protein
MKLIGIFTTAAVTSVVVATGGALAFLAGVYIGMSATGDEKKTASGVVLNTVTRINKDNA